MANVFLFCKGYTNNLGNTFIALPRKTKDLFNEDIFYLAGCIIGDGCLESQSTTAIYDGLQDQKELFYSKKFLEHLQLMISKTYKIPNSNMKIYKRGNMYTFAIYNKWLTRFLNYFFKMPYGRKKNTEFAINSLLSKCDNKLADKLRGAFCAGLFDTDGHICKNTRNVGLTSQNKELLEVSAEFLQNKGVSIHQIKRIKNSWQLIILANNFNRFASTMGFRHPRKKKIQNNHLLKPAFKFEYCGVNYNNMLNNYFDIIKLSNLRICGAGDLLKQTRKNTKKNMYAFSKRLKVSQSTISDWESNKKALPLPILLSTSKHNKKKFYDLLKNTEVSYKCSGRGGCANKVQLPLLSDLQIEVLAKALRPIGEYKMHLIQKYYSDLDELEKILVSSFNMRFSRIEGRYFINSRTVTTFFKTFFIYRR